MPFTRGDKMQIDTSLALAHFGASAIAVVVAALAHGKPIDEKLVSHLHGLVDKAAAAAPPETRSYFDAIRRTLGGAHYEGP